MHRHPLARPPCPLRSALRSTLLCVIASLALTAPAAATPLLSLVWRDTGTDAIGVSTTVSQTIAADLVITLEAGDDVTGVFVSFPFDEDGGNELDFVAIWERPSIDIGTGELWTPIRIGTTPPGSPVPLVESAAGAAGLAPGFDSALQPGGSIGLVGPTSVTLGSVVFQTNPGNVATDGVDVRVDSLPNGLDAMLLANFEIFCTAGTTCPVSFAGASVNVPEPTSALLVACGLLALGSAARRR